MGKFRILVKGIVQCGGKYLVVERWYDDCIVDPYQWEFLDGEMQFSETPEKAVERIAQEKAGIPVRADRPLYTWGFTAGEVCTVGIAFECTSQTEEVVLSEDLNDSRWVSGEELSEIISNGAVRRDIEKAGLTGGADGNDTGKADESIEAID